MNKIRINSQIQYINRHLIISPMILKKHFFIYYLTVHFLFDYYAHDKYSIFFKFKFSKDLQYLVNKLIILIKAIYFHNIHFIFVLYHYFTHLLYNYHYPKNIDL